MRRGKEIAQGAHASMCFLSTHLADGGTYEELPNVAQLWLQGLFTKVVCRVDSEEELLLLHTKAIESEIMSCLITDAGKTEFDGTATHTAVALGPEWSEKLDEITGHLTLY